MSKDPAFLFYPNDYIGGTMGMTFEEKGAYIELLMLQFNRGHMTSHMIGQTIGQLWDTIKDKFKKDDNGLYYNERLEQEQLKRKTFTESRRNNIKGTNQYSKKHLKKEGHMTSHMEDENENEIKKVNPSFKEIENYGIQKGYNLPIQKIIDFYTNGGELNYWIDSNNKKVIRWKSKVSSVWFKDEFKKSKVECDEDHFIDPKGNIQLKSDFYGQTQKINEI